MTHGRLDIAFNNAGIQAPPSDAADEPTETFDRVNAINLRGVWACMKHELRQMRQQGSGAIVNCSSLGGLVGLPGRAAYHASKHGVLGLTKSAALEYAPRGVFTLGLLVLLALAGCGSDGADDASQGDDQSEAAVTPPTTPPAATNPDNGAREIVGTTVRFSSDRTSVDVTIGEDNPAVRDFLSMLPLTLTLEEFAGREKIGYLPRKLRHQGSPGSDPKDGDLIYFIPWGNVGFYYNAEGIGYSDDTIHLGTYDASLDQLGQLEGEVTIDAID